MTADGCLKQKARIVVYPAQVPDPGTGARKPVVVSTAGVPRVTPTPTLAPRS